MHRDSKKCITEQNRDIEQFMKWNNALNMKLMHISFWICYNKLNKLKVNEHKEKVNTN